MKTKKLNGITFGSITLNIFLVILSLTYIVPIIMMISISLSTESSIIEQGYGILPRVFTLDAYRQVFKNPHQIITSYRITIAYAMLNTALSLIVQTMMGYSLSRSNFKYKRFTTVYLLITMFFSGGLVPSYILNTQYLRLGNTFWIYIFPYLMSAWNVILFKTYFQSLPGELVEAAKVDGASEFKMYIRIILPLSTPVIATLGFMKLLGEWNNWNVSLLYIRTSNLYSLQYLLQRIINESEYIRSMQGTAAETMLTSQDAPSETLRYAMAVLAAGPMMIIFPFFQKYFAKGLVVGSVKG